MQNKNKNLMTENTETGAFDKFFGILKSDKSVSLEEMDNAGKEHVSFRLGDLPPFHVRDDFDNDEFPEFEESKIFPK